MYWCMEGTVIMYEMLTRALAQAATAQFVHGKRVDEAAVVRIRAAQLYNVYHHRFTYITTINKGMLSVLD